MTTFRPSDSLRIRLLGACLVATTTLIASAPAARAQQSSAAAQSLFDEGRRLMIAGKLSEACAAFDRGIHRLGRLQPTDLGLDGHRSLTPASRAIASAAALVSVAW